MKNDRLVGITAQDFSGKVKGMCTDGSETHGMCTNQSNLAGKVTDVIGLGDDWPGV